MSVLFGTSKELDELYFELYWRGVELDNDKERILKGTCDDCKEDCEGEKS